MRSIVIIFFFCFFFFSCEKKDIFRSETDERFSIIKEDITSMPQTPISFYWEPASWDSLQTNQITSCSTEEVRFEYPYIIANGVKFHAYYWSRTQNKLVGHNLKVDLILIAFNHEK
ncbi:hypothetical protein G8759_28340 [Spirosoma aureum]|uniref:Uncharacterized protein n=1 Tax=Spirosoma aureum TaxID=2692134 RepID=A0A6G9AUX1_9BACT|nr:hypothetical protein [Spirosoma aureum]QIP16271.1 hypothetical protein G8759_28340 [Spirosoma aureum]